MQTEEFCNLGTDVENRVKWAQLKEQRAKAATFRLDILVWGPSDDGSPEYEARCSLRDELRGRGHNANFSEELCEESDALGRTLDDEYIQAESAHAIIVIYGSRGTQTERDKFLDRHWIARKTYVLVSEEILGGIRRSLIWDNWQEMARIAEVISYRGPEDMKKKIVTVCDEMEKLRQRYYVKNLKMSRWKAYGS